jgi:hypothetical protein
MSYEMVLSHFCPGLFVSAYFLKNRPLLPLLKNEWVEMRDPALPCRRTHGGTGAGALTLVKPLPPKAVA